MGGALFISSSSTLTLDRCKFSNNTSGASSEGSTIYSSGDITIQNCLFYDNNCLDTDGYAGSGTGDVQIMSGTAVITNCTFTENGTANAVVFTEGGTTTINNCLFSGNSSTNDIDEDGSGTINLNYTYYDNGTQGTITAGSGNLTSGTVDFTDASTDDFTLGGSSVCRDAGNNSYVSGISLDLAENTRIQNTTVDIGCYEATACTISDGTISGAQLWCFDPVAFTSTCQEEH